MVEKDKIYEIVIGAVENGGEYPGIENIFAAGSICEKLYDDIYSTKERLSENALYVTVYSSKRQAEKGKQMFSFSYLPEDSDETYNIVNDSDKFMLKLEK